MGTKEKMSKFEPLYLHLDSAPAFAGARQALSSLPRKQHGQFREWLSGVDAYTLHKPVVRKFARRPTIVSGLGEQVQADLMDVSARSAHNGGINFLLVVIDVFSKKVWVEPLGRKTGKEVSEALFRVLRGRNYRFVQTDKGREFYNPQVSGVMEKLDAHHFSTENENLKATVVERVNKTLRGKIQRYLTHANTHRYIDALPWACPRLQQHEARVHGRDTQRSELRQPGGYMAAHVRKGWRLASQTPTQTGRWRQRQTGKCREEF